MKLEDCNIYIRAAEVQPKVLENTGLRKAYDYRLFYILEHSGCIQIEDQSHSIGPDSLIIIPPAISYDFHGNMKVCVLNFDATRRFSGRTQALCPPPVAAFDQSLLFETQTVDELEQPRICMGDPFVREQVLQIINHYRSREEYADAEISAMLKLLFSRLLRSRMAPSNHRIENIINYIHAHAASIRGNEEIAKAFGYHPVYMGKIFKQATGKTIHKAIVQEKLKLACLQLTTTEDSIQVVAENSGFSSYTHFCTLFKKQFGISPSDYRNKHLQQNKIVMS